MSIEQIRTDSVHFSYGGEYRHRPWTEKSKTEWYLCLVHWARSGFIHYLVK